jgi:hypothetical protein
LGETGRLVIVDVANVGLHVMGQAGVVATTSEVQPVRSIAKSYGTTPMIVGWLFARFIQLKARNLKPCYAL